MKTTCPIANVSPSKYTNLVVFNRMAEEMLLLTNIGVKCLLRRDEHGQRTHL